MRRCHCQSPPAWVDGGSRRSGSSAARLLQPGMPDGVLDLYPLRSRTMLLQPGVPHRSPAPAAPGGQPPLSAESGRPARPPGSAAAIPRAPVSAARDGSIFPFGHFSGTIRLWRNDHTVGCGPPAIRAARAAGKAHRSLAALLDLWPARPLRRWDHAPVRGSSSRGRQTGGPRQLPRPAECLRAPEARRAMDNSKLFPWW